MRQIVKVLAAVLALGVLAYARPASACGAQQKTTMAKGDAKAADDQAQPQQPASATQDEKSSKAQDAKGSEQQQAASGAQAQNEPKPAPAEQN
jgi:hypothetical protein